MRLPDLQTSFVGHQFHFLPICASTNAEVQAALVKNDATPEGLTILADHQTAGRGQRGNHWQAAAGQNLTFSVLLRPTFLAATQQFDLSIAVALAGYDTLRALLGPAAPVAVKWPNDLYVGDRKIGGILIENALRGPLLNTSTIGIGLNVNQIDFGPDLTTATSLARETGRPHNRATVLATLLAALEARYLTLRGGQAARLRASYLEKLYRFGEWTLFAFDGQQQRCRIVGIDAPGRLLLELPTGEHRAFGVQEVRFAEWKA